MDVLTPEQRRRNMSRIRAKNTRPELVIRRGLHAAGLRFRLHSASLPGRPDLVFPKYNAAVFVHGCFWHGHECPLFRLPATRQDFWRSKIEANRRRDHVAEAALAERGWRILVIWECSLKGLGRLEPQVLLKSCLSFIRGDEQWCSLSGKTYRRAGELS
jgi:DNA mismatch endonuclease, patch repair protein